MFRKRSICLYSLLSLACIGLAAPASAQFAPRSLSDPATGERYHIEGSVGLWNPTLTGTVSSEGLRIPGTVIDIKGDLGVEDSRAAEFQLVLRPTQKFKLRAQAIPMKYEQTTRLTQDIVFNGQRYPANTLVTSTLDWRAYRLGMEYDFVSRDRGFGGLLLEAKPTQMLVNLRSASPAITEEFDYTFPVPAIGGIVRVYVVPNISITGEVSGIKLPDVVEELGGKYLDIDIYGTLNFTNNIGAKVGYRSFNLDFLIDGSAATVTQKGLYFGLVARY